MITLKSKGKFEKADGFFEKLLNIGKLGSLDSYGKKGVEALARATPKDTGVTANSWKYDIERTGQTTRIVWSNTNVKKGVNIAIILQYGHGTGTGGYIKGKDYINPAIKPVFDEIADDVWKEVTQSK